MEKYYTPKEAANAYSLSEKTLKDWLRAGKVKGEKVGKAWRIADSELRNFLKKEPTDEGGPIDKFFVQGELNKVIDALLMVAGGSRQGMSRSEALELAGRIQETVDYLEEARGLRLSRLDYSGGAKFTRFKPQENAKVFISEIIDEKVNQLLNFSSDDLDIVETTDEVIYLIEDYYKNDNLAKRRIKPAIDQIREAVALFEAKDTSAGTTLSDAYKLAAKLRLLTGYIDNGGIPDIEYTHQR